MIQPPDLLRKLSRKLDQRRGVQLTPAELDLLVESGAYSALAQHATRFQERQCRDRSARSRSTSAAPLPSTPGPAAPTSKSSGTISPPDVNAALAQARAIAGRPN